MKIFSGNSNTPLAEKIAKASLMSLSPIETHIFPDGERRVRIADTVVDEHAVIIQSANTPVDENYIELFFILDGLKRSGAEFVTAVVPYFGYQRQDHDFRDGEAVSLEVMIKFLESLKIDKFISVDLHASRIPDLFAVPVTHLSALPLFAEKIREILSPSVISSDPPAGGESRRHLEEDSTIGVNPSTKFVNNISGEDPSTAPSAGSGFVQDDKRESCVLVSPDMGGIRRIEMIAKLLNDIPYAALEKERDLVTGQLSGDSVTLGSVEGKHTAFIVDDMISSGKTIVLAAEKLHKRGVTDIYVFGTHAIFSEEAPKILQQANIKQVFVTDTVYIQEEKKFPKLTILSVADMIAEALK